MRELRIISQKYLLFHRFNTVIKQMNDKSLNKSKLQKFLSGKSFNHYYLKFFLKRMTKFVPYNRATSRLSFILRRIFLLTLTPGTSRVGNYAMVEN